MPTSNLPLVVPRVNINGNEASQLVAQLIEVLNAFRAVENALKHAGDCIHGRNFQTFDDAIVQHRMATDAWVARMQILNDMKNEFERLALEIQRQDGTPWRPVARQVKTNAAAFPEEISTPDDWRDKPRNLNDTFWREFKEHRAKIDADRNHVATPEFTDWVMDNAGRMATLNNMNHRGELPDITDPLHPANRGFDGPGGAE